MPVLSKENRILWKLNYRSSTHIQPLIDHLAATEKYVSLQLSDKLPFYQEDNHYATSVLKAWVDQQVRSLEETFNTRNGNDQFTIDRQRIQTVNTQFLSR